MNTRTTTILGAVILILAASVALAGKPVQPPAPGDISAVNAGAGLQGGGTTGDVTLSLKACGAGQSLVWDGVSAWQCQTAGDITGVTAGSGLTGGGNSGPVTVGLMACPSGTFLKSTGASWACEAVPNDPAAQQAVVVDANGKVVGPVVGTGSPTEDVNQDRVFAAYRTATRGIVKLFLGARQAPDHLDGLRIVLQQEYFFATPDCVAILENPVPLWSVSPPPAWGRVGFAPDLVVIGSAYTSDGKSYIGRIDSTQEVLSGVSMYRRNIPSSDICFPYTVYSRFKVLFVEEFPFTPPFYIK